MIKSPRRPNDRITELGQEWPMANPHGPFLILSLTSSIWGKSTGSRGKNNSQNTKTFICRYDVISAMDVLPSGGGIIAIGGGLLGLFSWAFHNSRVRPCLIRPRLALLYMHLPLAVIKMPPLHICQDGRWARLFDGNKCTCPTVTHCN